MLMFQVISGDRMSSQELATFALNHLDYTLLDPEADEMAILGFLQRAIDFPPAAVCVLPHVVAQAREMLDQSILVASAAGCFPAPNGDINERIKDISLAIQGGADEIDIVMDFEAMMELRPGEARSTLQNLIDACDKKPVKVILETSCLDVQEIEDAARIAIECGAKFLKSSTGRRGGCTPLVSEILADIAQKNGEVGVKISGGIRTLEDLKMHVDAMSQFFDVTSIGPERFRIGASSLLDSIENSLM